MGARDFANGVPPDNHERFDPTVPPIPNDWPPLPVAPQPVTCATCGKSITRQRSAHLIDPDVYACQGCLPGLILSQDQFDRILAVATTTLDTLLGIRLHSLKSARLGAGRSVLRSARRPGGSMSSIAGTANVRGRILVKRGYTYEATLGVLCHEMGHIWQYESGWDMSATPPLVKEGFCDWVALKALQHLEYQMEAATYLYNADPVYGIGLQYFIELEKKATTAQIVNGQVIIPALLDRFSYLSKLKRAEQAP